MDSKYTIMPANDWCRVVNTNKGGVLITVDDALGSGYKTTLEGRFGNNIEVSVSVSFGKKSEAQRFMRSVPARTAIRTLMEAIGIENTETIVEIAAGQPFIDVVAETKARTA